MATSDQVQAKIETFSRQLAEEFGEITEEDLQENSLRRARCDRDAGSRHRRCCHDRTAQESVGRSPSHQGRIDLPAVRQAGPLSRQA